MAEGLCTETLHGKPPLDTTMTVAAALHEVAPLVKAVAVEWRRYHHHSDPMPHSELIDALHELAEAVGYPAVDDDGEPLPMEETQCGR
jgi:hypothetical protein